MVCAGCPEYLYQLHGTFILSFSLATSHLHRVNEARVTPQRHWDIFVSSFRFRSPPQFSPKNLDHPCPLISTLLPGGYNVPRPGPHSWSGVMDRVHFIWH